MFALDLILKKRNGGKLDRAEIEYLIQGYTNEEIPDYQVAAFLMAVFFQGMDADETLCFTEAMLNSGEVVDLSGIPGIKTDKHSTGGVGDKTTLVVAPIVASLGVPVAKMSGRGLGHTGGTIDKLESIPGFRTDLSREEFLTNVREIGLAVAGQTGNLAPADKKLYALRDVTGTVDNVSLIAASIMSKKLASGADAIVLDVKTGSGAFMKTPEEAELLARTMVNIGNGAGRKTVALITEMDRPLGLNIGNSLEVSEAVEVLKGGGPEDLKEICVELAANMLFVARKGTMKKCREMSCRALSEGIAFLKLSEMVKRQGGDPGVLENTEKFKKASVSAEWKSEYDGYIQKMHAEKLGMASLVLGAGRKAKNDIIDPSAGISLLKKIGDKITRGETLAVLYTSNTESIQEAVYILNGAVIAGEDPVMPGSLVLGRIE
jgi:pyrimidine-nucleoside phosphorylase